MKNTTYPLNKLVEVEWEDAASCGQWDSIEGYKQRTTVTNRSVGYLHVKTNKIVQLLQSQGRNGRVADSIAIPRVNIKAMRILRGGLK